MVDRYPIRNPDSLLSPSLLIFREHLLRNIEAIANTLGITLAELLEGL